MKRNTGLVTLAAAGLLMLAGCGGTQASHAAAAGDPAFGINVTAAPYSAACDGSTDDTTAFQHALNAFPSTGGRLFVPASAHLCKITSTLDVPPNVIIEGESPRASVIWCDGCASSPVAQFGTALGSGGGTTEADGGLQDIGIDGNSATNTGSIGVLAEDVANLTLNDVYVQFVGKAFDIDGGTTGTFSASVTISDPKTSDVDNGIYVSASGGVVTDLRCCFGGYLFGTTGHATGYAVYASALNTSQFFGVSAESFNYGIYFTGTSSDDDVFGTRVESIDANKDGTQDFVCSGSGTVNDSFWEPIDADISGEATVHNLSGGGCDLDS
jgi:hypothetical protein